MQRITDKVLNFGEISPSLCSRTVGAHQKKWEFPCAANGIYASRNWELGPFKMTAPTLQMAERAAALQRRGICRNKKLALHPRCMMLKMKVLERASLIFQGRRCDQVMFSARGRRQDQNDVASLIPTFNSRHVWA